MLPTNKKESLIFTGIMCSLMVMGMSAYNLLLHQDFSWTGLVVGFVPGFILAFILDEFVIGAFAKKIAFKASVNPEKPMQMILLITSMMVLGMVTCMSLFGLVMELELTDIHLADYFYAWRMNFIVALPLQLFLVGPFSRRVLKSIQIMNKEESTV